MFARCVCINLDRRPDRWERFLSNVPADWPWAHIERFSAVDGQLVKVPEWWKQGVGAWGCYRSHLAIIEQALTAKTPSLLILEDDALFPPQFTARALAFIDALPADWEWLYLGGQHLHAKAHPPQRVNDLVARPYNVNRTHAYALRGRMLRVVYDWLTDTRDWRKGHHIDHHFGRMHQRRAHPIYCPREWLLGQAAGRSNINGKDAEDRFWQRESPAAAHPFVAVVGLHSSGSSAVAGVLYHLGLHLGNHLGGYWGNDPTRVCGFEAAGLRSVCETAIPFPKCEFAQHRAKTWSALSEWIDGRRREAARRQTIAGGKYPQLCRLGPQLLSICGPQLRVVDCHRPIEDSIRSLVRREGPRHASAALEAHQRWLWDGKQELLAAAPAKCTVDYHALLTNPAPIVRQLADFCGLMPTPEQFAKAVSYVRPEMCHIKAAA